MEANSQIRASENSIAEAYDRIGALYDRDSDQFHNLVAYPALLDSLQQSLHPLSDKRILDVGCGSGKLLERLESLGARACGVDISSTSIQTAKARGCKAHVASMLNLPFGDGSFDATISYFSINYVAPHLQKVVLQEQFRVLSSTGAVAFACAYPATTSMTITLSMFGERIDLYIETIQSLETMLKEVGFRDISCMTPECPPCPQETLDRIESGMKHEDSKRFVRGFATHPFALFVSAKK